VNGAITLTNRHVLKYAQIQKRVTIHGLRRDHAKASRR